MKNEVWKDIPGYEGCYQVSDLGRIKSLTRTVFHSYSYSIKINGKIMKGRKDRGGYLCIGLHKNGKGINKKIHRIVALLFIHNENNLRCVNHIDGNKKNNRVENLEWCDHSYNNKHAYLLGLKKSSPVYGEKNHFSKLTNENIIEIRKSNKMKKDIARQFNIDASTVWLIRTRRTWNHI